MNRVWRRVQKLGRQNQEAVEALLKNQIESHPSETWPWCFLCDWYWVIEDHVAALGAARKAFALDQDVFASALLMRSLWMVGSWKELEAIARNRCESHPSECLPHVFLSEVAGEADDEAAQLAEAASAEELTSRR
jgi:hypothetical protein